MSLYTRLAWSLWRRRRAGAAGTPVNAHFTSHADGTVTFGRNVTLWPQTYLTGTSVGDGSYVAMGTRVHGSDIGKYSSVGPFCLIGGMGKHPTHLLSTHPLFYSDRYLAERGNASALGYVEHDRVIIGNDVWIGARSIVLDGVTIGDGAIIAAGTIVNKDVPAYAVVGGVPGRLIRYRFDEDCRAELLRLKWWDADFDTVRAIARAVAAGTLDASDTATLSALLAGHKNRGTINQ